jgi:hypothetical protein
VQEAHVARAEEADVARAALLDGQQLLFWAGGVAGRGVRHRGLMSCDARGGHVPTGTPGLSRSCLGGPRAPCRAAETPRCGLAWAGRAGRRRRRRPGACTPPRSRRRPGRPGRRRTSTPLARDDKPDRAAGLLPAGADAAQRRSAPQQAARLYAQPRSRAGRQRATTRACSAQPSGVATVHFFRRSHGGPRSPLRLEQRVRQRLLHAQAECGGPAVRQARWSGRESRGRAVRATFRRAPWRYEAAAARSCAAEPAAARPRCACAVPLCPRRLQHRRRHAARLLRPLRPRHAARFTL